MALPDLVMIVSRLALGAIATILAVVLWSLTRDTAWMFVVMATILKYGEVIGRATRDIEAGAHAHVQNIESLRGRGDWEKEDTAL